MHEDDRKNEVAPPTVPYMAGTSGAANVLKEAYGLGGVGGASASSMPLRMRLEMRMKEAHYQREEANQRIRLLTALLSELTPEIEQAVASLAFVDRLRAVGIHI